MGCVGLATLASLAMATAARADSPLTWSAPLKIDGTNVLQAVSCPSPSLCVAVDNNGNAITTGNPGSGAGATWTVKGAVDGTNPMLAVSCPSTSLCVAVDNAGNIVTTTDPGAGPAATWTVKNIGASDFFFGVSCPSTSLCVAVDSSGHAVTSTDPADAATATWQVKTFAGANFFDGVSCPSTSLCIATDNQGNVVTTTDPADGTAASWTVKSVDPPNTLSAVSCPSTSLCVAVDSSGDIAHSTDPADGSAATWTVVSHVDTTNYINGVTCPSPSLCVAIDDVGNVVSTSNPTGSAGSWTVTTLNAGADTLYGVACRSTSLCVATDGAGNVFTGAASTTTTTTTTTSSPPTPPAPTPKLADMTPGVHGGGNLVLTAAGSTIPAGQRATSYTFRIGTGSGAQTTTCPGQLPQLTTVVTRAATTTASVTVTTNAGTSATTSTPIAIAPLAIAPLRKPRALASAAVAHLAAARPVLSQTHTSSAKADIGTVGALASQCTPPGGGKPGPAASVRLHQVEAAVQAPSAADPQLPACATAIKVGIISGLGCFERVGPDNPLGSAEAQLLCGHAGGPHSSGGAIGKTKFEVPESPVVYQELCRGDAGSFFATSKSGCYPWDYDLMWQSSQPVSVDGLEIDPVNGAKIVVALAGSGNCTQFASSRAAYLISGDAVVKVGGLPITLQVPKYSTLYSQAQNAGKLIQQDATCAQNAATGLSNGDPSSADCLGSIKIPSVSFDGKLIPQINGPIDLSVSPDDLGIELGEFTIPSGVLPLPVLPKLPLSGTIKVTLTGIGEASAAVHVALPILQDGNNNGLTGDTTFHIDTGGFHLDTLDIKVPSLAQLGLARLRDLEFAFTKPSRYETRIGTIDLSDVIDGCVGIHFVFDHSAFQEGDVHYRACGAGGGAPLFGPLFLTQLDAALTLHPTHIHGHILISVGPALNDRGCGAFGVDGTADLVFGNPWTLDAVAQGSILCQTLGTQKIFHADTNGNVSYGEHLNYAIPDLGSIDYNDFLSARASIHDPLRGIRRGDFLGMQLDASGSLAIHPQVCEDFPVVGTKCIGFDVNAGLEGTVALGYNGSRIVGGAGVCSHFKLSAFGQDFGFDVGAGIDDLPGALLAELTGNFIDVYSHVAILTDGCNVSRWRLLPPPAGFSRVRARGAQQLPYSLRLPASGSQDDLVGLEGLGGAPQVTLTGPNGKSINATRDGINIDNGALVIRQRATGQTLIEIPHATAGNWKLTPQPGSAAIRRVQTSVTLPPPRIKATVSGRGTRRVLRYRIGVQPGLGVRFAEMVGRHLRPLETSLITRSRGAIRFTPALGPRGRRVLIAQTIRSGIPGARYTVGSYTPGANATAQQLTVRFIDGEQVLLSAAAAQRSVVLSRKLDHGAQPTAVAVVALRGTTRGRITGIVAKPRGGARH
jgi:hypothetical protein